MKKSLFITIALILCVILSASFTVIAAGKQNGKSNIGTAEEQPNLQFQWTDPVYHLQLNSSFDHIRKGNLLYTSHITGLLDVAVQELLSDIDNSNTLSVELRTGIGEYVRNLGMFFTYQDEDKTHSTGSVPCIITASNVTEKSLNKWLILESEHNPALQISLTPMQSDVQINTEEELSAPLYTNPESVDGKIFVLDDNSNYPRFRHYADISIPAGELKLETTPNNTNQQGIGIHLDSVSVTDISMYTWKNILRAGNKHLQLPRKPVPGNSTGAEALPYILSGRADTLHALMSSIESMYIASALTPDEVSTLLEELDDILNYNNRADIDDYVASLLIFESTLEVMSNGIEPEAVSHLCDLSNSAITGFLSGGLSDAPDYTPSDPEERVDWYVDADSASTSPDGSISDPFPSILSALEAAEAGSIPGVNLHVYGGVYRDPLLITRDTVITEMPGEIAVISGSITNGTPALLSISDFNLIRAGGPGAVYVHNSYATTVLSDCIIESAEKHGVFQSGGELWMTNSHVRRTRAVEGVYWNGAGIVVTGGCTAVLNNVSSEDNESNGVVADGAGTYLWASNLEVNSNHVNRFWEEEIVAMTATLSSGMGALVVQYNALATLNHVSLVNNEFEGIIVHQDSSAEISDLFVYGTYAFIPDIPGEDDPIGGLGIRVRTDGYADIDGFITTHNDLAGILFSTGGEIDLHNGAVCNNTIGIVVLASGFDYTRLMDRVAYYDNNRNLVADELPVPEMGT